MKSMWVMQTQINKNTAMTQGNTPLHPGRQTVMPGKSRLALRALTAALLIGVLPACSLLPDVRVPGMDRIVGDEGMFRDRKEEYLEARTIPRTEIPAGLDSYVIDDLLIIPDVGDNRAPALPDPPRPMPAEGSSEREVVIQRMGNNSWIIADASPSQVWPRIRDYWRQKGIPVASEDPSRGLMDTGWFTLDGNVLTQERVRVTVETGFQNNSAEIRLLHQATPQAMVELTQLNWPQASMDSALAYDLTLDMSTYLADVANLYQASTTSFLATNLSGEGKASLTETSAGNPVLTLQADFDRSWAAVRRVLFNHDIAIVGEDSSLGQIDISFDPLSLSEEDEEAPGFFSKVFTLNGLLFRGDERRSYQIRLQLLQLGDYVEVLAVPGQDAGVAEGRTAAEALMRFLRNRIA